MHGLLPQAATLRRLRVHGGGGDALRARLRLEAALGSAEWMPRGLPPQAVLLVRRLVLAPSPSASLAPQVSRLLQACAGSARRPWRDADAAAAEAVLFADEAELAACLASDALRGRICAHWWWHAVLAGRSAQDWLRARVLVRGQLLPAVLALLAERAQAVAWAACWNDADARAGLAAVVHAHAWHQHDEGSSGVPSDWPGSAAGPSQVALPIIAPAALTHLLQAVPELRQAAPLRPPAARLLCAALLLARDAAWLKSTQGTIAWAAWAAQREQASAVQAPPGQAPSPSTSEPGHAPLPEASRAVAPVFRRGAHPPRVAGAPPGIAAHPRAGAAAARVPHAGLRTERPLHAAPGSDHAHAARPVEQAGATGQGLVSRPFKPEPVPTVSGLSVPAAVPASPQPEPLRRATPPMQKTDAAARRTAPAPAAVIHTGYAGLFYLLNIALALNLYGDFTMPRHRGLALSPWDLLALAGRHWFGRACEDDALWPVLAGLAGRSAADPPGRGFMPPSPTGIPGDWLIDPDWLLPWGPQQPLTWRCTARRVQARHPAGFVVRDVALGDSAVPRGANGRWLRHLLAYICARTALAWGCIRPAEVPALLCRHAGEVHVTSTAVDVMLSLQDLPLPLRLAGLDRNPGWIPASGRSIAFHFE